MDRAESGNGLRKQRPARKTLGVDRWKGKQDGLPNCENSEENVNQVSSKSGQGAPKKRRRRERFVGTVE